MEHSVRLNPSPPLYDMITQQTLFLSQYFPCVNCFHTVRYLLSRARLLARYNTIQKMVLHSRWSCNPGPQISQWNPTFSSLRMRPSFRSPLSRPHNFEENCIRRQQHNTSRFPRLRTDGVRIGAKHDHQDYSRLSLLHTLSPTLPSGPNASETSQINQTESNYIGAQVGETHIVRHKNCDQCSEVRTFSHSSTHFFVCALAVGYYKIVQYSDRVGRFSRDQQRF